MSMMGPDVRRALGRARLEDLLREARQESRRDTAHPGRLKPRHPIAPVETDGWS
jgi:hypothetical protein